LPGRLGAVPRVPGAGPRGAAGGDVVPVDQVPQLADVVGADVPVLQVVGVLPGVEDEQRDAAPADVAVVVVDLLHDQAPPEWLPGQDAPAGALDGGGGDGELLPERLEAAEVLVDGVGERAVGAVAAVGGEV